MNLLHGIELLRRGRALVFRLPGLVGHAVNGFPALVLAQGDALRVGGVLEPVGQAVAAEACEIHQVDVLDVRPRLQMIDQAPESGCLELRSGFVVDCHGWIPRLAKLALTRMGFTLTRSGGACHGFCHIAAQTGAEPALGSSPGPYAKSSMI